MTRLRSRCLTLLAAFTSIAILAPAIEADDPEATDRVTVEWIVQVPLDTPKDAKVYVVGSAVELGAWSLPGMALTRRADGRYMGKVVLPQGMRVEYKVTRGSWETVEKGRKGEEMTNRRLTAEKNAAIEIEVESWAAGAGGRAPANRRTGMIKTHERFKSKVLANERTVWVWLPPDYDKHKDARYPVLYMHDGQNLFDAAGAFIGIEWGADETADRLIREKAIPPIIIVGIANTPNRMSEYTPWVDESRKSGGKGEAYSTFLIDEVKPFIDKNYRTKADRMNTAVAGSSLGGLISLHLAMEHPEVFSKCAAISPALMWADGRIMKEVEAKPERLRGIRLWFDMGTKEGRQIETFDSAVTWTRRLKQALDKGGLRSGQDYRYVEVEGGEHNEAAWAVRFDQVLEFLFAPVAAGTSRSDR